MIVFKLKCKDCNFGFEGWFENSKEYSKQQKNNQVSCPNCNNSSIIKSIMAPNVSKKSNSKISKQKKTMINDIKKFKKIVEKNFDYVGDNFTEEAKKIKYGETEERPIYGQANLEQTKELIEEDIVFTPLPWSPAKKSN